MILIITTSPPLTLLLQFPRPYRYFLNSPSQSLPKSVFPQDFRMHQGLLSANTSYMSSSLVFILSLCVSETFWAVILEKTPGSPINSKEIKPVNSKGNQPWIFIGRTDAEAAILWSPDAKSQIIGNDPDAGKDWAQKEKGTTENEMGGWRHRQSGHDFEQTLGG